MVSLKALVLFILALGCANAAVYNYGPTDGWKELIRNGLQAGDVLNLSPGTYDVSGYWSVTLQGSLNNPIVIQGATGGSPVIIRRTDGQNVIDISNSYNFKFYNIQFANTGTAGVKGVRLGTGVVYNAIFDSIKIESPTASGFTANDNGVEYYNITLKNSIIENTSDSGECVYVGCNNNDCRIRDSLFDHNYCFNTLNANSDQVGSGFQIKSGSYKVTVSNNVCYKTRGVCVLLYDSYNKGDNIAEGNLVIEAGNNGIQATAGAIIRNNIVLSSAQSSIAVVSNQPMSGADVRNVQIYHNTVTNPGTVSTGEACIRINNAVASVVVANNALFCLDRKIVSSGQAISGATYLNNFGVGDADYRPSTGFTQVTSIANEVIDPSANNYYPKSTSVLRNAGTASYTNSIDYNTLPRSGTPTVGAYHYSTATNPGPIPSNSGLKQFPASASTTATATTATTASATTANAGSSGTTNSATTTSSTSSASSTTGSSNVIYAGPTRSFKDPAAAVNSGALTAGGTLIVDDGTYTTAFDVPDNVPGFTIRSASGDAYKCKMDGRGGAGAGNRLAWGKGIIHVRSPGTIIGIGFVNGGGADDKSDGEAGLYAESFLNVGTLNVVNCSFDGNENGIFVPGATGEGKNVDIVLRNSVFSRNSPNGVASDGGCHNLYIQGKSFYAYDNIHFPSKYGNNLKSRALTIYIADAYNQHDQGRCLDIPSGGQLTVRGGVYTAVGPTAVSNFFCYACENTNSGVSTPDISGLTIVGARYNDQIWNNVDSITIDFKSTTQKWANSNPAPTFNLRGKVTGIVTSKPANEQAVAIPTPTLPSWINGPPPSITTASATTATTASATTATTGTKTTTTATTAATTATTGSKTTTAATSAATGTTSKSTTATASTSTTGNPAPTTNPNIIRVGPTRDYKDPASVITANALKAGMTMIIDDGTYTTPFDVPDNVPGFMIRSASGDAYKCKMDGRGGGTGANRLAWGKGIIHVRSPGTIFGIGFVNGGGSDDKSDGEAGLYAELFTTPGTLNVLNCSFDGNENGIFVPNHQGNGKNITLVVQNSVFSRNSPNGVASDGGCHNVYIQGNAFYSYDNIHYPSKYGNNLKSRALTTYVADAYNKHDQGRCLDIPSGGKLIVKGGVYTASGPTAVSNFFCYACENTDSGVFTVDISDMTIVGARYNDAVWNNVANTTINFRQTTQKWANSSPAPTFTIRGPGNVTGLLLSKPASDATVAIPEPTLPAWINGAAPPEDATNTGGSSGVFVPIGSTGSSSTTSAMAESSGSSLGVVYTLVLLVISCLLL